MTNHIHIMAGTAESRGVNLWSRIAAGFRHYRERREHRRAMAFLLSAEPRLLKDIGLDRATVTGHYMDPGAAFRCRPRD
ncbi:hypothetical protein [Zavarzinia sp.]|uniref:hypothetical protein n=1 Tax=Zavarzinia sp. TaxID=2027920 RepID=UPI003BB6FD6D|nr:hypothetical protein [Zavarzinia sp.]